uniref:Chemokine interleukin-8-like domain-containing protein n=1 Tax=Sinocyclocheilus rhinocerous TaxID=307959 RepID=A0A673I796_9TELE
MKFTLFAAFLFSIGWMSLEVAGDGRPRNCCKTVSNTNIPVGNIVDYIIQNTALCSIRAVRFHTKKNKVICSDPDSDWAKNVMKIVDWRTTTKPSPKPTSYTSTTNVILTVNTTNKTQRTETETSTSMTCETKHEMPGIGSVPPLNTFLTKDNMVITTLHNHTPKRIKPSKLKIKLLGKSKKGLRKGMGYISTTNVILTVNEKKQKKHQEQRLRPARVQLYHQ